MKLADIKPTLVERIYAEDGSVVITIQSHQEASDKVQISTFTRRHPYETNLRGSNGATIYSVYNYVSSPEITRLLSSMKGKGPYTINPKQVDSFLERTAAAVTLKHVPDVIIYPKSSSDFLTKFATKVGKRYPSAKVLGDAFMKKLLKADDVEPLINTSHPDWEKFSSEHPADVAKLKKSISKMIRDNNGELEMKNLYKPYLKFIKNFIEMRDAYEVLESVIGKNVLVVDDVLSTGSTMLEMVRQIAEYEPSSIAGLTIFKHTTTKTL